MSKTLAVAARELRERWLLFPAGLVLGCVPLVLPALGLAHEGAPLVGLVIALSLGTAAAVVAGASMLARDAVDGRLAFLFSRPVPWPVIWGGKWLAAIVLVTGSGVLAALPWMLVHPPENHGGSWRVALLDPQGSAFFLLLLFLGIGVANFNATAIRSRSAWLAFDLGFLLLALWALRRWVAPLYFLGVFGHSPMAGWGFLRLLGPVALALVLASAAQVAVGRTDVRRAHRAMSIAFWSIVFVTLAAAGLRLAWARGARPSDLSAQAVSSDTSGRWLYVSGESRRGGWMTFLIDTETERYHSAGLGRPFEGFGGTGMAFSADAHSGVTLLRHGDGSALHLADLTGDEPRFTVVPLESSPPPSFGTRLALSPSGRTILLAHEHGASLFAVPSGERVATETIPPGWRPAASRFLEESTARVWLVPSIAPHATAPRAERRILEIAVGREDRRTVVPLAAPVDPVRAWPSLAHPDARGRRFLTRDGGVRLRDGETGALLATLIEGSGPVSTAFIDDGRIVVGRVFESRTIVHVFAPDGTSPRDVTFDRTSTGLGVGPEVAPGRVAVHFGSFSAGRETVVIDLSAGRVVETLPGLCPMHGFRALDAPPHAPGGEVPTVHFFRGEDDAVVRRDFATGEQRVVAGPGAPAGEPFRLR